MPRNYFSQGGASEIIGAGNDAFDRQTALYDDVNARYTATRAGRRMAQGDHMGASREYANAGLLDEARMLESDQVAADNRMRQDREREAAAAKAKRDEAAAAAKAQAEAGIKILSRMAQLRPDAQDPRIAQFMAQGLPYERALEEFRKAEFDRAMPIFESFGTPPETIAQLRQWPSSNFSDDGLMLATGEMQDVYDKIGGDLKSGIYGVKGGKVTVLQPGTPQNVVLGRGQQLFAPDGRRIASGPAFTHAPRGGGGGGGGTSSGGGDIVPDDDVE